MSYGLQLTNSDGDILIDGEHVMPKLYYETTVTLDSQVTGSTGTRSTKNVDFPPTSKNVFVVVSITNDNAWLFPVRLVRNASNQIYRATLEGTYGATEVNANVIVRVYEL